MFTTSRTAAPETRATRALLACGVAAGPVFTGVALVQVLTRDGFDLTRHPLSLLSLGDLGWVQIGNFVVTGLLSTAFAVGMRRTLPPSRTGTWGSWLYGAFGAGMVAGGLFLTDPALGFPPESPAGNGYDTSWHSLLHDIAAGVSIDLALVACLVVGRHLHVLGHDRWAAYSVLTGVVGLVLSWWPDQDGISVRLAAVVALVLAWATALALRLRTDPIGDLR